MEVKTNQDVNHQRTFLWPVGQKGHDTHEHNNFAQRILPCEWINIPLMSINSLTGMEIKNSDCCQVDLHTIYFYNAWWNVERYSCFNLIQDNKARQGLPVCFPIVVVIRATFLTWVLCGRLLYIHFQERRNTRFCMVLNTPNELWLIISLIWM
jgi:hypothetical protein